MTDDVRRGADLLVDADALELEGKTDIAYRIRKYVRLVVDRDAGPSDALKGENTALKRQLDAVASK
jgi:hypothetical protein